MYFLLIYIFYLYIIIVNDKKLLKYAIDYLSKYDSSKNNLLEVLKRKIFKSNILGIDKSKLLKEIDNILLTLENNNLINDDKYTFSKISIQSRLGKSKNFIFNYLIKKGVNKTIINDNFEKFKIRDENWELESAKLFAKKKRLLDDKINYEKKLAKMARAGFSYDICKKVLG